MTKGEDIIKVEPSFSILDSTKITTYVRCPRRFFYEYILGWRVDGTQVDLDFGDAFHDGMEELMQGGLNSKSLEKAVYAFMRNYDSKYPSGTTVNLKQKTTANAGIAFRDYINYYQAIDKNMTVKHVEVIGDVEVDPDNIQRRMYFKIDAIVEDPIRGVYALEHKTTGWKTEVWMEQWLLSIQIGTYIHALKCLYPDQMHKVFGAIVNGIYFGPKRVAGDCIIEMIRVPVQKSSQAMRTWMSTVLYYMDELDWNTSNLMGGTNVEDATMSAFPMRPTNCGDFNRICCYHDFCTAWSNPLQHCDSLPQGMKIEHWTPLEKIKDTSVLVEGGKFAEKKNI